MADGLDALHASVRPDEAPAKDTYTHRLVGQDEAAWQTDSMQYTHRFGEARLGDSHTHRLGRIETARSRQSFGAKHHHQLEWVKLKLTGRGFGDSYHVGFAGVKGHAERARLR